MPYIVKQVSVTGFQGSRNIELNIRPDFNFIIGRNGTGKTTFVRLLHSCLSLELDEIAASTFDSIEIKFTNTETGHTPVLRIERQGTRRSYLSVTFRAKGRTPFIRYFVDEDEPIYAWKRASERNTLAGMLGKRTIGDDELQPLTDLRRLLKRELQFSWLPLLRSRTQSTRRPEFVIQEQSDEPINRKIRELIAQITTYLATLDSRVSEGNKRFQREVFSSYMEPGLFSITSFKRLDLEKERSQLLNMVKEMDYHTGDLAARLDKFLSRTRKSQETIDTAQTTLDVDHVVNIISANALHRIVNHFNRYTINKLETLKPQNQFIDLLNTLLYKKEAYFDDGNVLKLRMLQNEEISQSRPLDVFDLSSGEKQLLVILSETLLQQQRQFVFIADEPELSLHIDWQDKLVRTVREMNGNVQIIFATMFQQRCTRRIRTSKQ